MRRQWFVASFLLAVLARAPASALDPRIATSQYVRNVWTAENGLPQNSVFTILQTRDGYVWMGTMEGLVRFDGVRFTVFDRRNTPAMKHAYVSGLAEDSEGTLWVATARGLLRYRDSTFTAYTTRDGLSCDRIYTLCNDGGGGLWIATSTGGLNHFKEGRFTAFTSKDGLSDDRLRAITMDSEGRLWIATVGGGLNCLEDGRVTVYTKTDGLSDNRLPASSSIVAALCGSAPTDMD